MSSVRQRTDERETVKRGDKSRPKACTQLRSCRKWKVKKKKKKECSLFFWCVLPGRGHLLARLRGGSGQTCVRCNNPSSDGLQDQSIITSRENIYIRRVRSRGLRRFTAAFFSLLSGAPTGVELRREPAWLDRCLLCSLFLPCYDRQSPPSTRRRSATSR